MADIRSLTDTITVSSQITLEDLETLKEVGVTAIVMNRPDGEEPGQPDTAALKARAETLGITWADIPVVSGQFTLEAIEQSAEILLQEDARIHAFCRSGTRSTFLWGFAEALKGTLPISDIFDTAARAGYDLGPAAQMLNDLRASQ